MANLGALRASTDLGVGDPTSTESGEQFFARSLAGLKGLFKPSYVTRPAPLPLRQSAEIDQPPLALKTAGELSSTAPGVNGGGIALKPAPDLYTASIDSTTGESAQQFLSRKLTDLRGFLPAFPSAVAGSTGRVIPGVRSTLGVQRPRSGVFDNLPPETTGVRG